MSIVRKSAMNWRDIMEGRPSRWTLLKAMLFGKKYVCTDVQNGATCTVIGYFYNGIEYIIKVRRIY